MGCGGDKSGESAATASQANQDKSAANQLPPADVTAKPGAEIAREPVTTMPLEGVFIRPYFDEAGTVAQSSVAAGQRFTVGVWAETAEPYTTNAAQYRLEMPAGIRVTSVNEFAARSASMGNYAENFQIAYACQPSGRFRLVEYFCVADAEFKGGEIRVSPGFDGNGNPYIGFSTCDFQLGPAEGGSAMLKRK